MSHALVIFKPDASYRLAARAGIWGWLSSQRGWKVESLAWFQPPAALIESHYDFLKGKPFFSWLVDFMTALPLVVGRVTAPGAILEHMRHDLGETRIAQARPGSLRERYGIYGGVTGDAGAARRGVGARRGQAPGTLPDHPGGAGLIPSPTTSAGAAALA